MRDGAGAGVRASPALKEDSRIHLMKKGYLGLISALAATSLLAAPPKASALTTVTATGTNPTICNQSGSDLGSSVGDITAVRLANGDCVVKFLTVKNNYSWDRPIGVTTFKVLVVGGGGGAGAGGSRTGTTCSTNADDRVGGGGGGGGGGQVRETTLEFSSPSTIAIAVGGGGAGGAVAACGLAGNNGSSGGSSSISTFVAVGGGGGGGGTSDGAGGSGGASTNSLGASLAGSVRVGSTDCTITVTYSCYAAGGGAGSGAAAIQFTSTVTNTRGGAGGAGVTPTLVTVSGSFGGGGGGGNRHSLSSPGATRYGGTATDGGGAGLADGVGTAGTANTGGGGGGGRGNGSTGAGMVNAAAGTSGGSGIVAIQYTPATISVVTAPSITGTIYKGISSTISVSVELTGIVRFFVDGKRIATCKDRTTSGSYPNNVATCSWKPPVSGYHTIKATLTPSNNLYSTASASAQVFVRNRTTSR